MTLCNTHRSVPCLVIFTGASAGSTQEKYRDQQSDKMQRIETVENSVVGKR